MSSTRITRLFLVLALVAGQFVAATAGSAGPTVFLDEPFETPASSWTSGWFDADVGSRNRFSTIAGQTGDGLRVAVPAGSHFGSAAQYRFAENGVSDPTELYYRYFLRFPDGFDNYGRGKLPGPAGLYSGSARNLIKPSNAQPGWSARMAFSPTYDGRNGSATQIGFYTYHRDQPNDEGEILMWDPQTGTLDHGLWHCVEGRVSMNAPGVADGVLEGWVNEQLAFYQDDFKFRGTSDPSTAVKSFWFDVYYGGDATAPGALNFDFDGLVLADDRVGCGQITSSAGFRDTSGSVHADGIDSLAHAGITSGCNPPTNDLFCPKSTVTRGQMAAFLNRALELPAETKDRFVDDDTSVFEADIQALAAAGVTAGCNPPTNDKFCPNATVTRGQMAAFLVRALDLPPESKDRFVDDDSSVFEEQIQALAAAEITLGCNPPTNNQYCPEAGVTREQMATFLTRALDLPPAPTVELDGPLTPTVPAGYDAAVPTGWSIQAVANAQPPGAKIWIEKGVHLRQTVTPRTNQQFVGAPGAILDGLGEFDSAFSGSASGLVIDGIEFRNYDAAVFASGPGWTVRNNTFGINDYGVRSNAAGTVVSGNTFTDIVRGPILMVDATNPTIDDNTIVRANTAKDTVYAAGIRLRNVSGATVSNNEIRDSYGYGIWYADGSYNTTVTDNEVTDAWMAGIFNDYAYVATISGNTVSNSGDNPDLGLTEGSGIKVRGPDVEIFGNTLIDNKSGVIIYDNSLTVAAGPRGPYIPDRVDVHDNLIIESGINGMYGPASSSAFTTSEFEANDYQYADADGAYWRWALGMRNWSNWQAEGHDTTGTFTRP